VSYRKTDGFKQLDKQVSIQMMYVYVLPPYSLGLFLRREERPLFQH